jgi:hypothetical protein
MAPPAARLHRRNSIRSVCTENDERKLMLAFLLELRVQTDRRALDRRDDA